MAESSAIFIYDCCITGLMKKITAALILLFFVNSISAQQICEYNGIRTEVNYQYGYQDLGTKMDYRDEKFVLLSDPKAVRDLGQLKGLSCLELADFYNQGVSGDLENLGGINNLKALSLHTNPNVTGDICVFSKATRLKSLKLAFDEKVYGDISCLKNLNLDTFAMTYAGISGKLSDLSHMANLKALYLSGTNVTGNISALSGLSNLEELALSHPALNGSGFYGDLASLDNLKKLRKVSLYGMNFTSCEHFEEAHPGIEGGCSQESKSTLVDPNTESEKMIGKGTAMPTDAQKDGGPGGKGEPPRKCIVNGEFIGEEKCRELFDGADSESPSREEPPKECMANGEFIGEEKCRELVGKNPPLQPAKIEPNQTAIREPNQIATKEPNETPAQEPKQTETQKNFLQSLLDWLMLLFR